MIFEQAPHSLLSLGAMLDEYICLKEQKVFLEQEKLQVQNLLRGMQEVTNGYNASENLTPSPPFPASSMPKSGALLQQTIGSSPISAGFNSVFFISILTILTKELVLYFFISVIWDPYNNNIPGVIHR